MTTRVKITNQRKSYDFTSTPNNKTPATVDENSNSKS
jgi:hypothetical protein